MKFFMRVFGTISATQGLYETNDFSTLLKSSVHDGKVHTMRKQWICCDYYVAARNKNAHGLFGKVREECMESGNIVPIQDRKPWKGASLAAIERRWNAPDSAPAVPQFRFLDIGVFLKPVGGIGYNCMNGILVSFLKPRESICEIGSIIHFSN